MHTFRSGWVCRLNNTEMVENASERFNQGLYVTAPKKAYKEVDCLTDSAQEILEKMAYEAHGGKYIVGLWEAPMPGAVTPIRYAEAEAWEVRPMEVEYKKGSTKKKMINGMPISVKTSYRQKNKNFQFFGYKSEPPSNPLFKEDEPVGPVAKAIKSAGTLMAIGKEVGENVEPIRDIMKSVWNVDMAPLEAYVQPDLSNSSPKDLIKLQRNTTHSIAGFPCESPGVAVHLTSYRSETIDQTVFIDWHRVALAMRWIGEWNSRYNIEIRDAFYKTGKKQLFTPVLSEMPRDIKVNFINFTVPGEAPAVLASVQRIALLTVEHYVGMIKSAGVSSRLRSKGLVIGANVEEKFDAEFVRKMLNEPKVKVTRLPVSITEMRTEHLELYRDPKVTRSLVAPRSKLEFEHHFSGRGALKTLLEAYLHQISGTKTYSDLRALITQYVSYDKYGRRSIEDAKKALLRHLPDGFGDMLYTLLRLGTANDNESNTKYADLLKSIAPNRFEYEFNTKSSLFVQAIKYTDSLEYFMKSLGGAYRSLGDSKQSERGITFRQFPGATPHDIILDGLERFANRKLRFWAAHYDSRITIYVNKLKTERKSDDRGEWKLKVVTFAAIKQAYLKCRVRVGKNYWVTLETRPDDWVEWGIHSIENYLRKRLSRQQLKIAKYDKELDTYFINGVEHAPKVTDDQIREMRIAPNNQALFALFDKIAKPKHSFITIWNEINRRLLMTQGSIGVTFRARICTEHKPCEVDITKPELEDVLKVLAGNMGVPVKSLVVPNTQFVDEDIVITELSDPADFNEFVEPINVSNPWSVLSDSESSSDESISYNVDSDVDEEVPSSAMTRGPSLLSVQPESTIEREVRDRVMTEVTSTAANDLLDFFGEVEEDDNMYEAPKNNIVDLARTINAEFGSNFTNQDIAKVLGIDVMEAANYNLNWELSRISEIYRMMLKAVPKKYNVDFDEIVNEGRDIA